MKGMKPSAAMLGLCLLCAGLLVWSAMNEASAASGLRTLNLATEAPYIPPLLTEVSCNDLYDYPRTLRNFVNANHSTFCDRFRFVEPQESLLVVQSIPKLTSNDEGFVLPRGTFSPILGPFTVTKETRWMSIVGSEGTRFDSLASLWAQRMLWEMGGKVVNDGDPGITQIPRTFKDVFVDASHMSITRDIVLSQGSFAARALELAEQMHLRGVLYLQDFQKLSSWVSSLQHQSYPFPPLKPQSKQETHPVKPRFDVTAVVWFSFPPREGVLEFLSALYEPMFKRVIFSGLERPAKLDQKYHWISCPFSKAHLIYKCLVAVIEEHGKEEKTGFLFISDDTAINPMLMHNMPLDKVWYYRPNYYTIESVETEPVWWFWKQPRYRDPFLHAVKTMPNSFRCDPVLADPNKIYNHALGDFYYLPAWGFESFVEVAKHFGRYNVFEEMVSTWSLLATVCRKNTSYVNLQPYNDIVAALWKSERTIGNAMTHLKTNLFVHPLKLSAPGSREVYKAWIDQSILSGK